jgi:hypothetical protein
MAAVYIQIDENPNCPAWDGQIFQPLATPRPVTHVRRERGGAHRWCEVTGLDEDGAAIPALACAIEDSGEGRCYLVFGGTWGLRLRESGDAWDLADTSQWGEAFLLLGGDGADLRFAAGE